MTETLEQLTEQARIIVRRRNDLRKQWLEQIAQCEAQLAELDKWFDREILPIGRKINALEGNQGSTKIFPVRPPSHNMAGLDDAEREHFERLRHKKS